MEWLGVGLLAVWCLGVALSVARLRRRRYDFDTHMVPTMDLTDALATLERSGDEGVRGLPAPEALTLRLQPRLVIAEATEVSEIQSAPMS